MLPVDGFDRTRSLVKLKHMMAPTSHNKPEISSAEILRIVNEELPHWKAACGRADADVVILNQRAFGRSPHELFLLSIAIKYAEIIKKDVMIGA